MLRDGLCFDLPKSDSKTPANMNAGRIMVWAKRDPSHTLPFYVSSISFCNGLLTLIYGLALGKTTMTSRKRNSLICEVEIDCGTNDGGSNSTRDTECPEALFDWKFN